jgi:hypothetical protein
MIETLGGIYGVSLATVWVWFLRTGGQNGKPVIKIWSRK